MSDTITNQAVEQPPPTTAPPADPAPGSALTTTQYMELAAQLSSALAAVAAQIPTFTSSHPSTVKFVQTHQRVPNEFIGTVAAAVDNSPTLQGVGTFDSKEALETLQFIEAFRPVIDQMAALRADLCFTVNSRKAKTVAAALQMYGIAKQVARDPGSGAVKVHVENMQRDLRSKRRKKTAKTPAPAPPPTPPTPQP
jgi:hypothetical protein